jgi:O-antigen ligase
MAFRSYHLHGDASVFFYHPLTAPISQNAVFYSVYVLFALQFLLSREGSLASAHLPAWLTKWFRIFLIVFFLLMIVLLNSKLVLVIALLMLITFFVRHSWKNRRTLLLSGTAVLCLVIALAATNNPVRVRFSQMVEGDEIAIPRDLKAGANFNALQLRLLEWRFAVEILRAHHAWVFGVSPGDSQDLLDQKYIDNHMYIGNPADGPHRKIRGFIGYNFHNQFIETLVRSGVIGLASLLVIFGLLVGIAWQWKTKEAFFTIATIIVFFIPQSPLTMQHGVFLFCFFPLLLLSSPKRSETAAAD